MCPTAAGPVRPMCGAQIRKKTRRDALTPRSQRRYAARASPTSRKRGNWSTIRPLPRTTISALRQRRSSSSSETISPARRPKAGEEEQNGIIAASSGCRSIGRGQHACDLFW